MSLLQRQLGVGDPCTFRLIEKNVVSLLPPSKDQLKEEAAESLTSLLRYSLDFSLSWTHRHHTQGLQLASVVG